MIKALRLLTILIAACTVSAFLAGCSEPFEPGEVLVAAPLPLLEEDEIDIDALLAWAEASVRRMFPRAYYQGMSYAAVSEHMLDQRGRYVFRFGQRIPRPFQRGFVSVSVIFHVESGLAIIHYQDLTGRSPNMAQQRRPDGVQVREVVSIAHRYLSERGVAGCIATLTDLGDRWDVMCYRHGTDCNCVCDFEIVDGEIHEQRETICRDGSS